MFCRNCGNEILNNQTVCPLCGSRDIVDDRFGENVTLQAPAADSASKYPSPPVMPANSVNGVNPPEGKKDANKMLIAIVAVLATVLVIILAALVFKLVAGDKKENPTAQTSISASAGEAESTGGFADYEPQGNSYYVKDNAELITKREREKLTEKLEAICKKYKFDIIIHTTKTFRNKSPQEYSDDFYDSNGYGQNYSKDGCILVVNIETSEWYISTCGLGNTVLDDDGKDKVFDVMLPSFKEENYYEGFVDFADETAELLEKHKQSQTTSDTSREITTTTMPAVSSKNTPFYALFVGGYKDRQAALNEAERYKDLGYSDTIVIISTDWSNLNKERWYCVTVGTYGTKAEAENMLPEIQRECPDAYVKYTGDYKG